MPSTLQLQHRQHQPQPQPPPHPPRHPTLWQTYAERAEQPGLAPLATYLLQLMQLKRTNLCVSADVNTSAELLQLADDVGDHICVLKTHADIVDDFNDKTIRRLVEIARRKKFILFEDRKFGDIGSTLVQQYTRGTTAIVRWAPIVNAHLLPGPDVITGLAQAAQEAILSHNTSVSTDISASPAPSVIDSGHDDNDGDNDDDENGSGSDEATTTTRNNHNHHPRSPSDDSDEDEPHEYFDDRKGRKHSVVSVSTTISTKTETISPQPPLRPSISRGSTESSSAEEESDTDPTAALEALGPPPFFRALLLLAQMSSRGNFCTPDYVRFCVKSAREHRSFVLGFVAQQSLNAEPADNFITFTPGVQLLAGGDALGQQYNTPRKVVGEAGCDIIIVGRGVLQASDRRRAALEYRKQGWMAYEERIRAGRRLR